MLADAHIYLGVALAGLMSFLSPCVLPLVPPYLGFLGGTTLDQLASKDGTLPAAAWRKVVLASICFVLGFTTVFVGLGAGASAFGQLILAWKSQLAIAAGLLIILFGLHFLGVFKVALFYREARYTGALPGASLAGAYLIGLAFAFGWTPCVGPILAAVLMVATNEASVTYGTSMLLAYSLGLGLPFILAAVAIRPFLKFFQQFRRHLPLMEKIMGLILVATGVLFLTGSINWFGQWLLETFPTLGVIEEKAVPKDLPQDIMRRSLGK